MRKGVIFFISFLIYLSSLLCSNAVSETTIKANSLQYDSADSIYHLIGNVEIKRKPQIIRAEKIDYSEKTGKVEATGKVYYEDADVLIRAERASININDKTGTIFNAEITFKRDNYKIKASRIDRTGETEYLIYNASATTCDAPLPAWCFDTSKARLHIGDSLKARDVKFKIKGITAFYTPYLWAPVNTKRKSGLLFPTIGLNSERGLLWRQPLYFVLSENRDITFYLDIQGNRGIGEAAEYRYIERNIGYGNWWLYHIRDRKLKKNFFELRAEHRKPGTTGLTGFLNLNMINHKEFYREYSNRVYSWSSRFLQSTAEIAYKNKFYRAYIYGKYWQELRNNYQTGNIHQRLPEIGIYLKPRSYGPFKISIASSFTNYYSDNLTKIQRFDIYPKLRFFTGNNIIFSQSIGLRNTSYFISDSREYPDSINRPSFDYTASLKTTLLKHIGSINHYFEPEIKYHFVPDTNKELPLLDSTELYNRISLISLILRNYLYSQNKLLVSFKITQPYDFHNGDRPFLPILLQLRVFDPLDLTAELQYDTNYSEIKRVNYEIGIKIIRATLRIGQRYSKEYDILFYTGTVDIPVTKKLKIDASLWYDAKGEGLKNHRVSLSYDAQCWGIKITYDKRPGDYTVFFLIQLKGLGELKLSSFI